MPITNHPKVGQILLCDFSYGFAEPEMVKSGRPVVVISPAMEGRGNLVTVVAISSQAPERPRAWHQRLPPASLPQLGMFQVRESWVKGDMVYAVGFKRLDLIRLNKRDPATGKRIYLFLQSPWP